MLSLTADIPDWLEHRRDVSVTTGYILPIKFLISLIGSCDTNGDIYAHFKC